MNLTDFKNGENVRFEDEQFGQGKGVVLGVFTDSNGKEYCIIYPKIPPLGYTFSCFLTEARNLILTPF